MRWPDVRGVEMRTQAPEGQAAWSRRDGFATPSLLAAVLVLRANGQALPRLTAVGRPRHTAIAEGVLKTQPTGGHAEQASNAARGTPEKRRTCGTDIRTAFVPRGAKVRGSFGTPASRATSLSGWRAACTKLGRRCAARTMEAAFGDW